MSLTANASILTVCGPALTEDERAFLADARPWGLILMGRSLDTRAQVRALVDEIWTAVGRECLIFIDQEGGRVARLKPPEWPVFPRGCQYGELFARDPDAGCEAIYLAHRLMAHELREIGIHADCAPVLDLPVAGAHDVIGDRALAGDPDTIAQLGRQALRGLSQGGVAGVIKHIPGHGRARSDSHLGLPSVDAALQDMEADFAPFRALSHAPMAMTAHIAYDAVAPGEPATLSARVIKEVIRTRIGFDGLLMTDDLEMKALGGDLPARVRSALDAGCDVVLLALGFLSDPGQILARMRETVEATPDLSGKPLERALAADAAAGQPTPFDPGEARARLDALIPAARPVV
jgi:beta-N-acetylhexosaminidase